MDRKHIVILSHENDGDLSNTFYHVRFFSEIWREQGHKVSFVSGTSKRVPGDVVIVHVDLTDVPAEFLEYASEYPVAINGKAATIAKDAFSINLLDRRSDYRGKVIVKTRANYGGINEAMLSHNSGDSLVGLGVGERPWRKVEYLDAKNYPVFNSKEDVPPGVWKNPRLIVEKFLPETDEQGRYYARGWYFFGSAKRQFHSMSSKPTVKEVQTEEEERFVDRSLEDPEFQAAPLPEELHDLRRKMKIDFGMMDWGINQGRVVIYDLNKTPAIDVERGDDQVYLARVRERITPLANGLWEYL